MYWQQILQRLLWLLYQSIKDQATTALELSKILNVDVNVLKEKLNKKVSIQRISPEGRQLDNQVASKIQRLHLSGVYLI